MTLRRLAAFLLVLVATPLLVAPALASHETPLGSVPERLVPQEAGWGDCDEYQSEHLRGSISIRGRGAFYTISQLTDGCGGEGCDDRIDGDLYVESRQAWYPFVVQEYRVHGECAIYCAVETRSGWLSRGGGTLTFTNEDEVNYSCADPWNGWLFSGRQSPHRVPGVAHPSVEIPGPIYVSGVLPGP